MNIFVLVALKTKFKMIEEMLIIKPNPLIDNRLMNIFVLVALKTKFKMIEEMLIVK
jgi:hypothetical protein